MNIFSKSYTEKDYKEIISPRLTEEEYEKSLRAFVILCTDILIIDKNKKTIYLAKRKAKPMNGWWFIGGRMYANETKEDSAIRCFKRETDILLQKEDLELVALIDHRFKDREQIPQEIGCHTVSYVFIIDVEKINFEKVLLENNEYVEGSSFEEFDRQKLLDYGIFESMIDVYDTIFK